MLIEPSQVPLHVGFDKLYVNSKGSLSTNSIVSLYVHKSLEFGIK